MGVHLEQPLHQTHVSYACIVIRLRVDFSFSLTNRIWCLSVFAEPPALQSVRVGGDHCAASRRAAGALDAVRRHTPLRQRPRAGTSSQNLRWSFLFSYVDIVLVLQHLELRQTLADAVYLYQVVCERNRSWHFD